MYEVPYEGSTQRTQVGGKVIQPKRLSKCDGVDAQGMAVLEPELEPRALPPHPILSSMPSAMLRGTGAQCFGVSVCLGFCNKMP